MKFNEQEILNDFDIWVKEMAEKYKTPSSNIYFCIIRRIKREESALLRELNLAHPRPSLTTQKCIVKED